MFDWTRDVTRVSMAGGMLSIKMLEEFPSSNHHQTSWVTVSGNIFLPEVNSNQPHDTKYQRAGCRQLPLVAAGPS